MKIIFIATNHPNNYKYAYAYIYVCMYVRMHMYGLLLGENRLLNNSKFQVYNADRKILHKAF